MLRVMSFFRCFCLFEGTKLNYQPCSMFIENGKVGGSHPFLSGDSSRPLVVIRPLLFGG